MARQLQYSEPASKASVKSTSSLGKSIFKKKRKGRARVTKERVICVGRLHHVMMHHGGVLLSVLHHGGVLENDAPPPYALRL